MQYGSTPLENAIRAFRDGSVNMLLPLTRSFAEYNLTQIKGYLDSLEDTPERKNKKAEVYGHATATGNQELNADNYLNAIHYYTTAINANPSDAALYLLRSFSYARLFNGQNALKDAQRCVRLRPNWAKAYEREAAAWELLRDYRMALQALSNALRLQPGEAQIEKRIRYMKEEIEWNQD
ncbi:hypothetical protein CDL12_22122 [Handroanthus impetiginosus]|uniref:Uncharacterized protein n=1 Tax=Handroanthus impetiginosus TaxID=429701 RepID=A0A2G9GJ68_9LAMI|nr:hypothetical protein CDL12_22122 [Handroanthus impetiginosus]